MGARKAQNLTQQQLCDQFGIPQQTLAHYEGGRLRFAASMLPKLAQKLGLSVDEFLGQDLTSNGKRGPKQQKQFERISQLPRATQQVLINMLDGVLAKQATESFLLPDYQ